MILFPEQAVGGFPLSLPTAPCSVYIPYRRDTHKQTYPFRPGGAAPPIYSVRIAMLALTQ